MVPDAEGINDLGGWNPSILIDQGGGEATEGKLTGYLFVWLYSSCFNFLYFMIF